MRGIAPTELVDYESATASWLIELVDRLDRWEEVSSPR
jgi:hypothetical protein